MFGRTKQQHGPPDGPFNQFNHSDDCRILAADPAVEIPWSEVETRHWVRTCQCSEEHWRAPEPARVKQDPLDPATFRHAGQCEFKDVTDRDIIKVLLKVTPKDVYSWVECGSCEYGWQVADFAEAG